MESIDGWMDGQIGLGLQKVRTSTTVQPKSISRKDVRIRYLLITDLLKIGRQIGTKVQSTRLSYLGCTFILFVVVEC